MNAYIVVEIKDGFAVVHASSGLILTRCALKATAENAANAINACGVLVNLADHIDNYK